jgi:hypothetical protein
MMMTMNPRVEVTFESSFEWNWLFLSFWGLCVPFGVPLQSRCQAHWHMVREQWVDYYAEVDDDGGGRAMKIHQNGFR